MKTNFSLIISIFLLVGVYQAQAQITTRPGNGNQNGPVAPVDEAGGSPSNTWHINANGLHVNSYTNVGIGAILPGKNPDIF